MSLSHRVQATTETATNKPIRKVKEKPLTLHVDAAPSLEDLQAMPVHPIAAMFPMLSEEDLAELAADIAENGVNHPVVITRDGTLIDGRNRLAACALAKVEPPVTYFEGGDPAAFIISENVNRRHMTKGQCAMAVAMIYPDPHKGGRGKTSAKISEVSDRYIGMARTVLAYSRPMAQSVLSGMPLAEAYQEAKAKLDEDQSEAERQEKERAEFEANLARLRSRYPELARKVVEDGLSLKAMLVEASELDKQAKSQRQSLFMGLRTACKAMSGAGFSSSSELPNLPKYLASKEILKEFRAEFQGSPSDLVAMIPVMEQELAALKEVMSQLEGGAE